MEYISHRYNGRDEKWEDHNKAVAELASKYAEPLACQNLAYNAGYLHDAGKATVDFDNVLNGKAVGVNHSIPGAALVFTDLSDSFDGMYTRQIAFGIIKGHHAGLTGNFRPSRDDYMTVKENAERIIHEYDYIEDGKTNSLSSEEEYAFIRDYYKRGVLRKTENVNTLLRSQGTNNPDEPGIEMTMLFTRMLFSCLVDADYSSTAEFESGKEYITPERVEMSVLLEELESFREKIIAKSDSTLPINKLRNYVYSQAKAAGENASSGFYTMTAPTGTAKTLAMMRFGLECAKRNGQDRIIVVLPFLSIIDQSVDVYEAAFSKHNIVLRDDSSSEFKVESTDSADALRLISEKWDAQIIVTTNVRFFEALFSSSPKNLRRLHNIANSVVLFDEAQTLPPDVMDASVNTIAALKHYNCTVLFSTATQPRYDMRSGIKKHPEEIIRDVEWLYKEYEKVHNTKVSFLRKPISVNRLCEMLENETQALCIFNTTGKAFSMYSKLSKVRDNVFLLYTNMCSSHRKAVIKAVKSLLDAGKPCFLVSTQCIEAGVDLDFPVVCREYAPLPAIVQSLGRCNRNGKTRGTFIIFLSEQAGTYDYPDVRYKAESEIVYRLAEKHDFLLDLSDPKITEEYYRIIYTGDGLENRDKKVLTDAIERMDFVETDNAYCIIEKKAQVTIIVPYDDGKGTYDALRKSIMSNHRIISKKIMMQASPVTVNLYAGSKKTKGVTDRCLPLYVPCNGEPRQVNWYLMEPDSEGYSDESGVTSLDTPLIY